MTTGRMARIATIALNLLAGAALMAVPAETKAHGGALDAQGCHADRKTGERHCHRGDATPASAPERDRRAQDSWTGVASVIDGDTIEIHGQRFRLHGIDAPESRQLCHDRSGKAYRCGQQAALALADRIGRRIVTCVRRDVDRYKRIVAVCRLGGPDGEDLNRWMVLNGLAMAYRAYSKDYVDAEEDARAARRGIWQGKVQPPWEWRRHH
jgi:endonuclease YncB( thermonuclease family)